MTTVTFTRNDKNGKLIKRSASASWVEAMNYLTDLYASGKFSAWVDKSKATSVKSANIGVWGKWIVSVSR